MSRHRVGRSAALGLTFAALAASTAAAGPADLRSPDTRDAAPAAQVQQDLRTPDVRDAAAGRGTFNAPEVTVVRLQRPASVADDGIDWGAAGLGAGSLLGLIVLGAAGAVAVVHRRHHDPARHGTAAG